MSFAMTQRELNNRNSSCIGCGICVTVCPMDVLSFGSRSRTGRGLVLLTVEKPLERSGERLLPVSPAHEASG
jgi:ferredoxin